MISHPKHKRIEENLEGKGSGHKSSSTIRHVCLLALLLLMGLDSFSQYSKYRPLVTKIYELSRKCGQMQGPEKPEDFSEWLADVKRWREERLSRMGFSDDEYRRPEFLWTQKSFIHSLLMVTDRYFYDPVSAEYTVDRYLDDLEKRYGMVDCVIIWHHYPMVGIDNRNQFDLLRDMPSGVPALRKMVEQFHKRDVKVLFSVIPWDRGTRVEGRPDWEVLTKFVSDIGADGIYGDTFGEMPLAWHEASIQIGHPLVLEPQNALMDGALAWNNMTWAEGWEYSFVPSLSHHKWLEPRHMVHIVNRWARNRTEEFQHAFFNGTGYVAWENIWGVWNGISDKDAEALRRIAKVERKFSRLLSSPDWEPYTPTLQHGVFASQFLREKEVLWTIVNRNEYDLSGPQLKIPWKKGTRFFDVFNGTEIIPEVESSHAILDFKLEGRGFGAVLSINEEAITSDFKFFLEKMKILSRHPLNSYSDDWKCLTQKLVKINPTEPAIAPPPGMIHIPEGDFDFEVSGIEIEGENRIGVGVQYPWESIPRRHHREKIHIKSFYIDQYPVTNADFKMFVEDTNFEPKDDHNFLRHWKNSTYPEGWAKKPVIWVSIEDAKAYAEWAGKRLPHEWEWQYAAQGTDSRLYPWGNEWTSIAVPEPDKGREIRPTSNVDEFPDGASPFGVMDLVGNVWQWTDEYRDEHTRFTILRGGSYYQPQGSPWYFPQAYRLDQHGKYLLMSPSRDRAATIGFRCVVDTNE
jgi:iron(II)-dependent oxidoreductase